MASRFLRAGIIAASVIFLSGLAAQAADLRAPYKSPAYVAPAYYSWSGFYVGINGGYGFGTADWPTPPPASFKTTGYLAGLTLGYNYQTGAWVWGLEGDVDYSTEKGNEPACGGTGCDTKLKWFGTARARIGYAFDRWLPYITGGAAFGNITNSGTLGSESKTKLGWTAGLGLEYAFLGAWSAKVEYLYADLGTMTCDTCFGAPQDIKFKTNIVRLGVNYRF
jgi:outer membrane immunogenic protein